MLGSRSVSCRRGGLHGLFFRFADSREQDGVLDFVELANAFNSPAGLGIPMDEEDLQMVFSDIDTAGDKSVSVAEFEGAFDVGLGTRAYQGEMLEIDPAGPYASMTLSSEDRAKPLKVLFADDMEALSRMEVALEDGQTRASHRVWTSNGFPSQGGTSIYNARCTEFQVPLGHFIQTSTSGSDAFTPKGVQGMVATIRKSNRGGFGWFSGGLSKPKQRLLLERLFPLPKTWRRLGEIWSQDGKKALVIWEGVPPKDFAVVGHAVTVHEDSPGEAPSMPEENEFTPRCVPMTMISARPVSMRAGVPMTSPPVWTYGDKMLYRTPSGHVSFGDPQERPVGKLAGAEKSVRDIVQWLTN
mmetsp:Transcript_10253/g.22128  ORF Transcript_10253/g.22128 Transcript_10253/m.22128 type:complete len:356 (-) Transcript_10253:36-1103(-)